MLIYLSFKTWGDSVPMQLKFKQSVNSLCTYFFKVMFFFSLILVLININLTGDNDPEMVTPSYSICQVIQVF